MDNTQGKVPNQKPTPKRGEKYRHFKGEEVEIYGISESPAVKTCGINPQKNTELATHSETEAQLCVYEFEDSSFALAEMPLLTFLEEPFVLYWHRAKLWARPLDNFLEVLGDVTKFCRFERIARND